MRTTSFVMNFVMLAIFTAMVVIACFYPRGARFMPFVIGIPGILLCLLQIALDLRAARRDARAPALARAEAEEAVDVLSIPPGMVTREIILWSYFLGLIGGILLVGFWLTIPLFLLLFLHFEAELSWPKAVIVSAVGSAIPYFAVTQELGVQTHEGFLVLYLLGALEMAAVLHLPLELVETAERVAFAEWSGARPRMAALAS